MHDRAPEVDHVACLTSMSEPLDRRRLFRLDFVDATGMAVVTDALARTGAGSPVPTIVVTPNVDHLVRMAREEDAAAARTAHRATWVLPDGQPIVWASRLLGAPLRSRLAGSDLVAALFPRLVAEGRTVAVVASSDDIARRVCDEPGDTHALVAPMLDLSDPVAFGAFVEQCAAMVRSTRPDHLFVTLGFPKQCNVIDGLTARLDPEECPVMLAVGASFDMHYGLVRRSPVWMQRWGLEWAFRFAQEPRRLFRRYFLDDPAFLRLVWREWRARQPSSERRRDRRRFDA